MTLKIEENQNTDLPKTEKYKTTLVTFLILLTLVTLSTLWMASPYLVAVVMGGILALLTYPLYQKLLRRFSTNTSALLVTTAVVLLVIIPIGIFVSLAAKQAVAVQQAITENEAFSFQSIIQRVSSWAPIEALGINPESFDQQFHQWFTSLTKAGTDFLMTTASELPNNILQLILAVLTCFFFLVDGKEFLNWFSDKIPLERDVRARVIISFKDTAISSIWATLAAAGAQALVILISFIALNVPAALLAGGATFILAWIPLIGSSPAWIIGAIYLYFKGSATKAMIMVIFGLVAGSIDNVVRPIVLKGRSNMHPLVSLVAIFGGIQLFGIVGIFLGPVLTAVLISLLQIWPSIGERFGLFGNGSSST